MAISIDKYVDINSASSGAGSGDSVPAGSSDIQLFRDPASGRYFTPSEYVGTVEKRADGKYYANGAEANVVTYQTSVTGGLREIINGRTVIRHNPSSWPMTAPTILASPPTITAGAANAASVISGSVLHSALEPGKFLFLGGPVQRGRGYPRFLCAQLGSYPQVTSGAPVAVEFSLDTTDATGRFELSFLDAGVSYRVLIKQQDGSWGASSRLAAHASHNDGSIYTDLITLGAAGTYQLRIEFNGPVPLVGIYTKATDAVTAARAKPLRYIVVGDSFTEPTIVDASGVFNHYGWVQQLAHFTGYDLWSAGSGATGYVAVPANNPFGRVKFSERLAADILAFAPDGVIFAGGINDMGADPADLLSECRKCFAAVRAAGYDLVVLSSFCTKQADSFPYAAWAGADSIKQAATEYSATYIDLLDLGIPSFLKSQADFSTALSSAYNNGTSVWLADVPEYFKQGSALAGLDHWWIRIGSGGNQAVAKVTNLEWSGSGPYKASISRALESAFAAGSSVRLCGPSFLTGTGNANTPQGDGDADRFISTDTTHPTMAGGPHIARVVASEWARKIAAR